LGCGGKEGKIMDASAAEISQDEQAERDRIMEEKVRKAAEPKTKKESRQQRAFRESVKKLEAKPGGEAPSPPAATLEDRLVLLPPAWPGMIYWEDASEKYIHVRDDGTWTKVCERVAMRYLRITHILNSRAPGNGEPSELDVVLEEIRNKHAVTFSGPRAGYFAGKVLDHNGERFLVTTSPTVIEAKEGEFPTISALLDGSLRESKIYFLAWIKDAVEGLMSGGERQTGKALVLAGPVNCGKSFIQDFLITPLLGGRVTEPYLFMSGGTTFSDSLAGCEHWKIDDQGHSDSESRRDLADSIKQAVAKKGITHHPKGKALRTVEAYRRLTISCNEEEKYLAILPSLDSSLQDKIMILRTTKGGIPEDHGDLRKQKAYSGAITRELPAFVHYLLNLEIDPSLKERFGVIGFKDTDILQKMEKAENYHQLGEILDETFEGMDEVEGTSTRILSLISNGPCAKQVQTLCRGSVRAVGKHLSKLVEVLPDRYKSRSLNGKTEYTITGFPKAEKTGVTNINNRASAAAEEAINRTVRKAMEKVVNKNGHEAYFAGKTAAEAVYKSEAA
jgi:hypothetical protein